MTRPFAPAAERNAGAILSVLRIELARRNNVLEIGSGTGQHAVFIGQELHDVDWHTSDVAGNCDGIRAWVRQAALPNVYEPIVLDVLTDSPSKQNYDAVFSANTAHIMSVDAVGAMFELVANALTPAGVFALYGPFRQRGGYNTDSNAAFDQSLRQRDPAMGLRDIEWLDELAGSGGLRRKRLYAMPANNHIAIWVKTGESG